MNIDAVASVEEILAYADRLELTFPIGYPGGRMVADFKIKRQSSKVALTPDGIVLYRDSYGGGSLAQYEQVLMDLAALADGAQN